MGLYTEIALRLSRVAFARHIGFTLDPWQARVLQSESPRLLLNCSRQSGKSTTVAIIACHTALYQPPALVLLLSRAQRQSQELFRKVLDIYHAVDVPVPAESESRMALELANGSRVLALPGSEGTIRSFSGVSLLLVDEAARVSPETYYSMLPVLAVSGGRLVALSTPFGNKNWFHDEWMNHPDDWARWEIPASQCPRIDPGFLVEIKRRMGQWWFEQEFNCHFMDAESAAFSRADILAAFQSFDTWNLDAHWPDAASPPAPTQMEATWNLAPYLNS